MTEILNVWIQSVWFWVAIYILSMFVAYFLVVKFKWFDDWEDGEIAIFLVVTFPHVFLICFIIFTAIVSIGNIIHKLATSDHLTEDEQKELKKRQSK